MPAQVFGSGLKHLWKTYLILHTQRLAQNIIMHIIPLITDWQTGKSTGASEEKERSSKRTDIQVAIFLSYQGLLVPRGRRKRRSDKTLLNMSFRGPDQTGPFSAQVKQSYWFIGQVRYTKHMFKHISDHNLTLSIFLPRSAWSRGCSKTTCPSATLQCSQVVPG